MKKDFSGSHDRDFLNTAVYPIIMKNKYNCIVICGPTASGKTALAAAAARKLNCEIISADSRQVYRGMDIGTGKDIEEYEIPDGGIIPYHLIDIAAPDEIYSLYRYLDDFYSVFNKILSVNKTPLICGGSGLYIEAAVKKFEIANVPEDKNFRESLMTMDMDFLLNSLKQFPEIYERTDVSSKKRIIRSLEIAEFSRHHVIEYSSGNSFEIKPVIFCIYGDAMSRNVKIDLRLEQRLEQGMVEEVRQLLKSGVTYERMQMFGLEYKWISRYLHGVIGFNEMKETLRHEIHRFAKRQMTWFRGMEKRGLKVNWIELSGKNEMLSRILEYPGQE
ncbi:MAG: tRNA (adenosine(37)-N6)-dimethylallyltransferase MiaA [Spirochaetes bacterium]|nr:tRNA (adenosine(37)-N6)-dimethylallyltransferase MiaA [Spirochaetota bacterium]